MTDTVQVRARLVRRQLPCGCEVGYVRCEEGLRLWGEMDRLYHETFRDESRGAFEAYEAAAKTVEAHFEQAREWETTDSG